MSLFKSVNGKGWGQKNNPKRRGGDVFIEEGGGKEGEGNVSGLTGINEKER